MSSNVNNNNLPLSVSSVSVGGIAGYAANLDTTSQDVATIFQNDVGTIAQYVNSGTSGGTPPTLSDVNGALQELYTILTQGFTPPGGTPSYLTGGMAQQLDPLFRSLGLVGINPATGNIQLSAQQAASWQNLVANSLILQSLFAYASTSVNRSFQSMLELDYVGTGNDLMSTQLGNLQSALSVTQQALDTLGGLQNLHNQIQMSSKGNFVFNYNLQTSLSAYEKMYTSAANAYFKATVAPVPTGFPLSGFEIANVPANTVVAAQGALTSGSLTVTKAKLTSELSATAAAITNSGAHIYSATRVGSTGATFTIKDITTGTTLGDFTGPPNAQSSFNFLAIPGDTSGIFGSPSGLTIPSDVVTTYGPSILQSSFNIVGTSNAGVYNGHQTNFSNVWVLAGSNGTVLANTLGAFQTLAPDKVTLVQSSGSFSGIDGYTNTNSAASAAIAYLASPTAFGLINTSAIPSGAQWLKLGVNAIVEVSPINGSVYVQQVNQLVQYRNALQALIVKLSAITPRINVTSSNPQGDVDPNSLLAKVQQVVTDIRNVFVANGQDITSATSPGLALSGYKNWLLDNYGSRFTSTGIKAGQYQQNITFAITAGQSLNDSQKENVNNFLFVFQQYYQSATAMLQQITQLIQQIAQNVSR